MANEEKKIEGGLISLYFSEDMARDRQSYVAEIGGREIQYTGMASRTSEADLLPLDNVKPIWTGPESEFTYVRTLEKGEFLIPPPVPATPSA